MIKGRTNVGALVAFSRKLPTAVIQSNTFFWRLGAVQLFLENAAATPGMGRLWDLGPRVHGPAVYDGHGYGYSAEAQMRCMYDHFVMAYLNIRGETAHAMM